MDLHKDCVWKDRKCKEICRHKKHRKEKCHCNLEPCLLYEKKNLFKVLKYHKIKKEN